MEDIIAFVKQTLQSSEAYKEERFRPLILLANAASKPHRTKPGPFSIRVSEKNRGETAFQRAIYRSRKAVVLLQDGEQEEITWKDIELPVVFSGKGRRPCIDLVGSSQKWGTFLCELKFDPESSFGDETLPDYAILQAILYYGIVASNYTDLDREKVYRESVEFKWKDVVKSKCVMIVGNHNAWSRAFNEGHPARISALIKNIKTRLGITVLFCVIPDHPFFNLSKVVDGKYEPAFILPDHLTIPHLSIVDFISRKSLPSNILS